MLVVISIPFSKNRQPTDLAGCACAVVNHKRLPHGCTEFFTHRTGNHVYAAASGQGNNDLDRTTRGFGGCVLRKSLTEYSDGENCVSGG